MPHILVAFASRYGATSSIAEHIAHTLRDDCHFQVTLAPAASIKNVLVYDAVVMGTPIFADQRLPDMDDFLAQYHIHLADMPTAAFIVCMAAANTDDDSIALVKKYINNFEQHEVAPLRVGVFSGVLGNVELNGLEQWLVSVKNLLPGDYRDFEAVRAWAIDIGAMLADKL